MVHLLYYSLERFPSLRSTNRTHLHVFMTTPALVFLRHISSPQSFVYHNISEHIWSTWPDPLWFLFSTWDELHLDSIAGLENDRMKRFIMSVHILTCRHERRWCRRAAETHVCHLSMHTNALSRQESDSAMHPHHLSPPCLSFPLTARHTRARTTIKPSGQANCIRQP